MMPTMEPTMEPTTGMPTFEPSTYAPTIEKMQVSFWTTTAIVSVVAIGICILTCVFSIGSFIIGLHSHLKVTDDDEEKPLIEKSSPRKEKEMTSSSKIDVERDEEARERRKKERKEKKRRERKEVEEKRGRVIDVEEGERGGSLEPAVRDYDQERLQTSEKKKSRHRDKDLES